MGGGRNGRYGKWVAVALLFLGLVYMYYLYRDVKAVLRQRDDQLASLESLQTRLEERLQGVHYAPTHDARLLARCRAHIHIGCAFEALYEYRFSFGSDVNLYITTSEACCTVRKTMISFLLESQIINLYV